MAYTGPAFYDDEAIFEEYHARRQHGMNANRLLEEPVMKEMIGAVDGLRIADLGCGDGGFGVELLAAGAAKYAGVDGSERMVAKARESLAGTIGTATLGMLEEWEAEAESYELVVSRLVLHYLAEDDLLALLRRVHAGVTPGGRFVVSVEHPVLTSCNASLEQSGRRGSWIVDDYFVTGVREVRWMGGTVRKHHRTVADYFRLMQEAGFAVEMLRESRPERERFETEEEYQRRMRIPLFLFLAGRKVG